MTCFKRLWNVPSITMVTKSCWFLFIFSIMTSCAQAQGPFGSGAGLCTSPQATSNRIFIHDVPENTDVGSVLLHLNVLGTDQEVRLRVIQEDAHVGFNPVSRNLTLIQKLDREKSESVKLELGCKILATDQEVEIPVNIIIQDVNDNPPVFLRSQYSANVSELTPMGTTIIRNIQATDADVDNWYITYQIVDGPFSEARDFFHIPNPAIGDVLLKKGLDYESLKRMTFQVKAEDNHEPTADRRKQSALAPVVVQIFDGDDQNPTFTKSPYKGTVLEDSPKGSTVNLSNPIKAMDQDYGINASIVYSIANNDVSANPFTIEPSTGVVRLANTDFKRANVFTLIVKATQVDNVDRYASTVLTMTVLAENVNAPRFVQPVFSVNVVESVPIGTVILTAQATDNDQGSNLKYTFASGQAPKEFSLEQSSGMLRTTQPLDYETTRQYKFKLKVSDNTYSDEAEITIDILNINDNSPSFPEDVMYYNTEFTQGGFVGRVKAIDPDPATEIIYSFKDNVTLFTITEQGDILLKGNKEDYLSNEYRLFIIARDNGSPPLEASAVAIISFEPQIAGASMAGGENNMILIIILGVICGCFLVVILIMAVYIYKRKENGSNHQLQQIQPSASNVRQTEDIIHHQQS